jgi:hypothetical protein
MSGATLEYLEVIANGSYAFTRQNHRKTAGRALAQPKILRLKSSGRQFVLCLI